MVTVTVTRNEEGKIVQFEATGHANFAKLGKDIVCAAVSSILQTTVKGLQEYVKINLEIAKTKGNLKVKIKKMTCQSPQAEAILETMVLGLKAVEKEYTKHLRLIERSIID